MARVRTERGKLSERQTAAVLLIPFLAVYALFLVYPFFRGIWISLHDWNLLEVAFNPAAKEFVGLENYVRMMWGEGIGWTPLTRPAIQIVGLVAAVAAAVQVHRGRLDRPTGIAIAIAGLFLVLLAGFDPQDGGRWYDRRFWPTVGNTLVFVALTVPGVTVAALVLAAMTNRQTRAMAVVPHPLLPEPGPLGDGRDPDLADHVLAAPGADRERHAGARRLPDQLADRRALCPWRPS